MDTIAALFKENRVKECKKEYLENYEKVKAGTYGLVQILADTEKISLEEASKKFIEDTLHSGEDVTKIEEFLGCSHEEALLASQLCDVNIAIVECEEFAKLGKDL